MYGSKDDKRRRAAEIRRLLEAAPDGTTQAELARALGIARSTIARDLAQLDRLGILLAQDDAGRLTLYADEGDAAG